MMSYVPYMNKSSHRLDKYHLFSKQWKEQVTLKLGKDEDIKRKPKICTTKCLQYSIMLRLVRKQQRPLMIIRHITIP